MMERAEYWAKFFSENNIRKSYFGAMSGSGGSRQMETEESRARSIPGRDGVRQMNAEQIDTNDSYVGSVNDRDEMHHMNSGQNKLKDYSYYKDLSIKQHENYQSKVMERQHKMMDDYEKSIYPYGKPHGMSQVPVEKEKNFMGATQESIDKALSLDIVRDSKGYDISDILRHQDDDLKDIFAKRFYGHRAKMIKDMRSVDENGNPVDTLIALVNYPTVGSDGTVNHVDEHEALVKIKRNYIKSESGWEDYRTKYSKKYLEHTSIEKLLVDGLRYNLPSSEKVYRFMNTP
ncbi:MAG: hypothetical protein AB2L14_32930 [Candidatus Xenobiia bacterium LiM19]